jgi:hypothetical protein
MLSSAKLAATHRKKKKERKENNTNACQSRLRICGRKIRVTLFTRFFDKLLVCDFVLVRSLIRCKLDQIHWSGGVHEPHSDEEDQQNQTSNQQNQWGLQLCHFDFLPIVNVKCVKEGRTV